jgi:hypothetical protein
MQDIDHKTDFWRFAHVCQNRASMSPKVVIINDFQIQVYAPNGIYRRNFERSLSAVGQKTKTKINIHCSSLGDCVKCTFPIALL